MEALSMWRLQHVMFDYQKGIVTAGPRTATHTLCESAQSKRIWRFHKSHFIWKFTGKMPGTRTATHTWCEPAQSKRMSRCHKSHLYWNLQEKCPGPEWAPAPALTPTVRAPQCGHTVWGKSKPTIGKTQPTLNQPAKYNNNEPWNKPKQTLKGP